MKTSIAMATYNGAQYIQEQLQSFLDQTRQPDELIITDDCSTDQTEAIVKEFAKNAPFKVMFFRNEQNLGYCGNFNAALMKTTGDLVFLSDQDDVWFPEKIEHMVSVAERHPEALVVMNDAALTDGELSEVGLTKIEQIQSAGYTMESFVMGCCCGLRRELLNICMPIPAGFRAHDDWIVGFAYALGAKIIDDRVLQLYRRHENNESQGIVNRTARVYPLEVFFRTMRMMLGRERHQRVRFQLEQTSLFILGLERAIKKSSGVNRLRLERHYDLLREDFFTRSKRLAIREKGTLLRITSIGRMIMEGDYKKTSGMNAIIRDLIG